MKNRKSARGLFLLSLSLLCSRLLAPGIQDAGRHAREPLWWDLEVELKTEGEYRTQEEETVYSGDFELTVLWTGTMERDSEDYRLFHGRSEITRWNARETASSPASARTLTSADFGDVPAFNMEYILKKEGRLHFAFFVNGFYVPRNESAEKDFIPLPSTEENQQSFSEVNYRPYVVTGSNRVCLEERDIHDRACHKEFAWTWKHQQWMFKEKRTTLFTVRHQARVHISVTPHFEK
jgi:hypothetical protein